MEKKYPLDMVDQQMYLNKFQSVKDFLNFESWKTKYDHVES